MQIKYDEVYKKGKKRNKSLTDYCENEEEVKEEKE